MTRREYAKFQAAFEDFMEQEELSNLSTGHLHCPDCKEDFNGPNDECPSCLKTVEDFPIEPHFSWSACNCCGTPLGGDRYDANGYSEPAQCVKEYSNVCQDCIYYAEYGHLDDTTMLDIRDSEGYDTDLVKEIVDKVAKATHNERWLVLEALHRWLDGENSQDELEPDIELLDELAARLPDGWKRPGEELTNDVVVRAADFLEGAGHPMACLFRMRTKSIMETKT